MRHGKPSRGEKASAGFSILEGLVALALTGLIMGGISALVAQWMPVWNRGFHSVQRADLYALALDRIAADLAEARYVTGSSQDDVPFFGGTPDAVTFVRPTLDPGERPGLEVVRISSARDRTEMRLVRRRARFTPLPPGVSAAEDLRFSSVAVLLRSGARIAFSYADAEGRWRAAWDDPAVLPSRVRIEMRDPSNAQLVLSTTGVIRAEAPARCASARSLKLCNRFERQSSPGAGGNSQ